MVVVCVCEGCMVVVVCGRGVWWLSVWEGCIVVVCVGGVYGGGVCGRGVWLWCVWGGCMVVVCIYTCTLEFNLFQSLRPKTGV